METLNHNNIVKIGGRIVSELEYSHEIYEEKFYRFHIEVERLSDLRDKLPIIVSERLIDVNNFKVGQLVYIEGQFRSYNQSTNGKNKLVLSIFVKEITLDNISENIKTLNDATFVGYICKPPIYRKTPLGREIADILVAVNRSYKKSDYIPCILWGRNAKFCETLSVGAMVRISGRIQARGYEKKYDDGTTKQMVAYEVSASKFGLVTESDEAETVQMDSEE
ncbi:MAG: single-stranded DNA-binding protein [Clostridia bacterium]|nr:single-stranded DNA-binding protein [Clostridia bacterium]